MIIEERKKLAEELSRLNTVMKVFPSDANFLLVQFNNSKAVYEHLVKNGIIVRDRSSVLHCTNCLRITAGTPEENRKLIDVLQKF